MCFYKLHQSSLKMRHCNCIVTRGWVYDEILPEPEGNPEGAAVEVEVAEVEEKLKKKTRSIEQPLFH